MENKGSVKPTSESVFVSFVLLRLITIDNRALLFISVIDKDPHCQRLNIPKKAGFQKNIRPLRYRG